MLDGLLSHDQFSVRFADGSVMWLRTDSVSEIVLNPVFLKFLALCVLLGGLLDRGGTDVALIAPTQVLLLWLVLGFEAFIWFFVVAKGIRALSLRGMIDSVYSPLLTLPMLLVTETSTMVIIGSMRDTFEANFEVLFNAVLRDVVVLVVFDILFSSYVVHRHPAFSPVPVNIRTREKAKTSTVLKESLEVSNDFDSEISLDMKPSPLDACEISEMRSINVESENATMEIKALKRKEVRVGSHILDQSEIVLLRSEDHYVTIVTTKRKLLARAKLSNVISNLESHFGVQISRSCWVSFKGVKCFENTKQGSYLVLKDGSREKIASLRAHAVKAALALHQDSIGVLSGDLVDGIGDEANGL